MTSYTYGGSGMQPGGGSWNNSNNGNYQQPQGPPQGTAQGNQGNPQGAPHGQQPLPTSPPYGRQSMYSHTNNMAFHPRSSQSPATGPDGLSAAPFDQTQHHYGAHDAHAMATAAPHHSAIMAPSSQSSLQSPLTAHSDGYTHVAQTRPGSNPSYYASTGPSQFPSYPPQHSPTQHSPTTGSPGARGLTSLPNTMHSYNRYGSYGQLPNMGGPVMSNVHHPGGQMSMVPGMNQHPAYGGQMLYNGHHAGPPPQSERPFKCDQCIQSFSRNHDLKRHKRIHLAVKPFPCNFCSKSFSRKDALKVRANPPSASLAQLGGTSNLHSLHNMRTALTYFLQRHRLVKGCENKNGDHGDDGPRRQGERERD